MIKKKGRQSLGRTGNEPENDSQAYRPFPILPLLVYLRPMGLPYARD